MKAAAFGIHEAGKLLKNQALLENSSRTSPKEYDPVPTGLDLRACAAIDLDIKHRIPSMEKTAYMNVLRGVTKNGSNQCTMGFYTILALPTFGKTNANHPISNAVLTRKRADLLVGQMGFAEFLAEEKHVKPCETSVSDCSKKLNVVV